ncbi:MAG: aminotransferase class I/II-fold pyridoxal phosphate-dependent enzyme [Oscillospiraceae bacterium]|nr:aminotransferase class I/II-fold pyridoxal phosphate-dependent enzyme [Oscillospiraceae bacterium]
MRKYEHGGDIYNNSVRLDFSVNTNPLGISERVKETVISGADAFGVYPDADYADLRRAIAEHEGVKSENILCSNGASEMIFAAVCAVMPKRALLIAPTFSEYERALLSVGCEIEYYTLKEENGFVIGSDFIAGLKDIDMAFICNPNNPAGNIADKALADKIADVCAENGIVCIIDECFMDLAENGYSMKGKLPVIKAFTKTYAMAGLRLGYIIGDTKICGDIKKQLPAWNVSAAAQAGGIAALNDGGYIEKSLIYIKREREFLTEELRKLGFKVFKSDTNFILIKGQSGIGERLLERGILIRSCANFRGLGESFYRIAVKTHTENAELIRELGDICG